MNLGRVLAGGWWENGGERYERGGEGPSEPFCVLDAPYSQEIGFRSTAIVTTLTWANAESLMDNQKTHRLHTSVVVFFPRRRGDIYCHGDGKGDFGMTGSRLWAEWFKSLNHHRWDRTRMNKGKVKVGAFGSGGAMAEFGCVIKLACEAEGKTELKNWWRKMTVTHNQSHIF